MITFTDEAAAIRYAAPSPAAATELAPRRLTRNRSISPAAPLSNYPFNPHQRQQDSDSPRPICWGTCQLSMRPRGESAMK